MSLSLYNKKRSFANTPEPSGKSKTKKHKELLFVVQKHHASHLHYDFRLEMEGVLKSWAVPKGPSLNPSDKRLAMQVEDHPFDYKDFEGIIPKGNYGAGTVIVWDHGTYEPSENHNGKDPEKQLLHELHKGTLSIELNGEKLKGNFALVKTKGREDNAWLLIKKKDRYAKETDITKKNKSVISGKTIEEVKENKKAKQWISNRDKAGKLKPEESDDVSQKKFVTTIDFASTAKEMLKDIKEKRKAAIPKNIRPMLATLVDEPFTAEGWSYEIKWDGYRALAWINGTEIDLRSRNNNSYVSRFYPVYEALKNWPVKAVVDGEIVVLNEKGISSFQKLQNWRSEKDGELYFYVFDLLWLYGYDVTSAPLTERRKLLMPLLPSDSIIRFSESFETNATEFLEAATKLGIEGIIAKKNESEYVINNRTKNWLKIKSGKRHEVIIGGYTINRDSSKLFSSLLLGVNENGKLKYMGQAGTGFTEASQRELFKKMRAIEIGECAFDHPPGINKPALFRPASPKSSIVWLKPQLVAEVRYQELTDEGIMRHPSFQGLRTDKKAKNVTMEKSIEIPVKTGSRRKTSKKTSGRRRAMVTR
jgi:bifunctional non-homologous end joining protein LigD